MRHLQPLKFQEQKRKDRKTIDIQNKRDEGENNLGLIIIKLRYLEMYISRTMTPQFPTPSHTARLPPCSTQLAEQSRRAWCESSMRAAPRPALPTCGASFAPAPLLGLQTPAR
uniref:Uncharacterized protein n=1 Tax=Arundo donax TaxID=35708 RepID=A0A0A9BP37_ARUDO